MPFDKETKIWSGAPKIHLHNPSISMGAVILGILKRNPSKIAQVIIKKLYLFSKYWFLHFAKIIFCV